MKNNNMQQLLSEEEYKRLKQKNPKKGKLKWLFLGLGIVCLIASLFTFFYAVSIPGFRFTMIYEKEEQVVDLSIFFSIFLMYLSMWFFSKTLFMNESSLRENAFCFTKTCKEREPLLRDTRQIDLIATRSSRKQKKKEDTQGKKTKQKTKTAMDDQLQFQSFPFSQLTASVIMMIMVGVNFSVFGTQL